MSRRSSPRASSGSSESPSRSPRCAPRSAPSRAGRARDRARALATRARMTRRRARGLARAAGVAALVGAALGAPARAQAEARPPSIGYLANEPAPDTSATLRARLAERGWVEGQSVKLWYRYAQGKPERLPSHADELVRLGVDVIVAAGAPAIEAARQATRTIPIVVATTDDPLATKLVASLAHPGGNLTGVTLAAPGLTRHRLEL